MNKNDAVGLSVSVVLHVLLLVAFGFLTGATTEPQQLGYIEVELGPFSEGRPVQKAQSTSAEAPQQEPEPQVEQEEQASPPQESKPVELPDEPVESEEKVQAPEAEAVSPEQQNNPEDVIPPEPQPEQKPVEPTGGGAADGSAGSADGAEGEGADEEKAAPYIIEGLNRSALTSPLPRYTEQVNATISMRITVAPNGRVVMTIPTRKGNSPALEQSVMEALKRWRFNPLPAAVPQDNQIGVVTFHFRLE